MNRNTRKFLLGCTSATAILAFAAPALAQDQTMETVVVTGIRASLQSAQSIKQNSDQVVDSITAVDIGALPDRNIAEALQRVPGVTVQRNDAPNDLTRMGSTGSTVFVRGLTWVRTLMNGRDEFSAVNGRQLSFADVSADLMQAVNIYKSPTAAQIEGGVGGTIDLVTRKPFDQDGFKFAVSGDYTYGNLIDRALPSANALVSDRWNTKIGEIGILASIDWQDQMNRTEGFNVGTWDCWDNTSGNRSAVNDTGYAACTSTPLGSAAGDHVMGPKGWAWRQLEFKQQRLASNVVLQWRPTDRLEFTLFAMNTYAHSTDLEHYVYNPIQNIAQLQAGTFNSQYSWTGGPSTLTSIDTRAGTGHNRESDISLHIKYNPTDNLMIEGDVQTVEGSSPYKNVTFFTGLNSTFNPTLDLRHDTPKVTWTDPGNALSDPANYYWLAAMDHSQYNVGHALNARIDADYAFGGNGLFGYVASIDAGFRTEQKLAVSRSNGYNWGGLSWNWLENCLQHADWADSSCQGSNNRFPSLDGTIQGPGAALGWSAYDGTTYTSATGGLKTALQQAELFHYGSLFGSSVPGLWVPKGSLAAMNTVDSYKLMLAAEPAYAYTPSWAHTGQSWARWVPYAAEHGCTSNDTTCLAAYDTSPGEASTGSRSSRNFEDTYAFYIQANYAHDTFLGYDIPIDGNIGLRIVRTNDEISSGLLVMPFLSQTHCTVAADPANPQPGESISCADWNKAVAFLGGTGNGGATVARPPVKSGYTSLLPSFNFRAKITDQIQARLAYSETIVRPDFGNTNTSATLNFNWFDSTKTSYGMWQNDPSGYGGNPYLKPMHATNYDFSLEYYFSPTGSVTFSMFHKDLSNYVFTATQKMVFTDPVSGQSLPFNYTTYVNGDKGKIEGFEASYTQFFDQLPGIFSGIGVQANYTKIYNSGGHNGPVYVGNAQAIANSNNKTLPIEGMSNDSYNVALMYSKYDIDARLAWNWRSRYLSSSSDSGTTQPDWVENYGQLDGSIFYTFLEHYKAGFQLYNITGNNFYTDIGYPDFHPRTNWIKSDRKYSFVIRANW